jgi:hypothetical protein
MAYNFTLSNSQFLRTGSTPVVTEPITMACHFYRKTNNATEVLVAIDNGTNPSTGIRVMSCVSNTNTLFATSNDGISGPSSAQTTATYSLNTWNHACSVFASSTSRTIYLNGGNSVTNTGDRNVTNQSNISIGARYIGGSVSLFADLLIAEVGIWNAALTAAEIASLAKNITCNKIRPQNLVFYAPLIRNLQDTKGGRIITPVNNPIVAAHPRVYA